MVERGDDKHGLKKVPVEMVELVWDIQRWFKRLRAHTQESSCKIVIEHGWVRDIHFKNNRILSRFNFGISS